MFTNNNQNIFGNPQKPVKLLQLSILTTQFKTRFNEKNYFVCFLQ